MGRADALAPGARGHRGPGVPVRLRAEDRRAGDLARVPRRRARARRDARQRRDRRGRHAQPARDRAAPDRGCAGAGRGARRDLHVAAGLRGAQRAAGGGGSVDVHEPAQLGRGHDPPARPGAGGRAPAVAVVLRDRRHRGARARLALGGPGVAARARLPGQRGRRAAGRRGRRRRALPRVARAARRARLRDRRRRGQGRRLRAAAAARLGRPRPALGDRLEVPADDRGDAAEADPVERRQVRRPAPVRRARARPRQRRHREDGDAAQRGGPRAQGRAARRRRDRAAGRRRDPADPLARSAHRRAQRPRGPAAAAGGVPVVRHADVQARRLHPLPEPRVPGPPVAGPDGVRGDRGRRRPGGEAGRAAPAGRARQDGGGLLPARRGAARRARPHGQDQRAQAAGVDRGLARAAVLDRCCSRSASRGSATSPPAAWRRSSAAPTRCWRRHPSRSPRRPGSGRRSRG